MTAHLWLMIASSICLLPNQESLSASVGSGVTRFFSSDGNIPVLSVRWGEWFFIPGQLFLRMQEAKNYTQFCEGTPPTHTPLPLPRRINSGCNEYSQEKVTEMIKEWRCYLKCRNQKGLWLFSQVIRSGGGEMIPVCKSCICVHISWEERK